MRILLLIISRVVRLYQVDTLRVGLVTEEYGPLIQKSKRDIGRRVYPKMLRSL